VSPVYRLEGGGKKERIGKSRPVGNGRQVRRHMERRSKNKGISMLGGTGWRAMGHVKKKKGKKGQGSRSENELREWDGTKKTLGTRQIGVAPGMKPPKGPQKSEDLRRSGVREGGKIRAGSCLARGVT